MDVLRCRDATTLAYPSNNRAQPAASSTASRGNLGEPVGTPNPWRIATAPMATIRQNALHPKSKGMATAKNPPNTIATFIVAGEPDAIRGVTEAVYRDLKDGNKDASIEFRDMTVPNIRVEAPTEEDAMALIRTAQRIAATHLSGAPTETKILFVEPPPNCTNDFQIAINVIDETKCARPKLESLPSTPNLAPGLSPETYKQEFSKSLCEAFENASSLHSSLILKIHLGYYILQTYKPGKFTFENFESMVKSPRATGQLETSLGQALTEGLSVEAAIRLIQADNSPCVPIDNQTPTSAQVIPTYAFESWHDDDRYETELEIIERQGPVNWPLKFNLVRTKMIPQSAQTPRFEATSISVGRSLDWNMVAMPGDEKIRASSAVTQYLGLGQAELKDSCDDFHSYPAVRLPGQYPMAKKLKSVTIKSIYRYNWKRTGYVVQFTINRRWESIHKMNRKAPTDTDFDVTIYADNWDLDSRVQAGETVGKIWGDDLRGLLRDETGDATGSALSRVQGLIETILDIRDFFESASRA
ncbi:hypothetical protein E0Z10_g10378 [Xylaria hypoxylon]|uniref:Uncharacterized protein n=1 Tax=Xylaria hypoxylon TaxID=37992 RepID=A0A4Z0YGJ2_9PEZI|nr:hypothetical protein E0Z10_g10378 [Xylaria hypoxylon]